MVIGCATYGCCILAEMFIITMFVLTIGCSRPILWSKCDVKWMSCGLDMHMSIYGIRQLG